MIAIDLNQLPGLDVLYHRIDTGSKPPIKKASRHLLEDRKGKARQVKEKHKAGVIQPSDSPLGSPVLLVKKKMAAEDFVLTIAD